MSFLIYFLLQFNLLVFTTDRIMHTGTHVIVSALLNVAVQLAAINNKAARGHPVTRSNVKCQRVTVASHQVKYIQPLFFSTCSILLCILARNNFQVL